MIGVGITPLERDKAEELVKELCDAGDNDACERLVSPTKHIYFYKDGTVERVDGQAPWLGSKIVNDILDVKARRPLDDPMLEDTLGTKWFYAVLFMKTSRNYWRQDGQEYLLGFGFRMFDRMEYLRFTPWTSEQLSEALRQTALELQIRLGESVQADPSLLDNRQRLYDTAFSQHFDAYRDGGFGELSIWEKLAWGAFVAPELNNPGALREAIQSLPLVLPPKF